MYFNFFIKLIFIFLINTKLVFADIVDVNNSQIIELSNNNVPIIDVRTSSEWGQTGVIPNSILLTFFDQYGNYNFDEWYTKLLSEINTDEQIILICRSGKRSKAIAEMMNSKLDIRIYNAKNGIISWLNEKLITVKPQIN